MEDTINGFIRLAKEGLPTSEIIKQYNIVSYIHSRNFCKTYKNYLKKYELRNKIYQYLITFTIADSSGIDLKNEDQLKVTEKYIVKLFLKNKLRKDLIRVVYVREGNKYDKKRPHWHFSVQMKRPIKKYAAFKNYITTIGNVDISKSSVKTCKNAIDYFNHIDKKVLYTPNIITIPL